MPRCRICSETLYEFADFGQQPLSDAFRVPSHRGDEFFFRLAVGVCVSCTMVQLMHEVPRELMFHDGYPYYSSGSTRMVAHFEGLAHRFLADGASREDSFVVELGCNDGAMLQVIARAGRRHVGVEPSGSVAAVAAAKGIHVRNAFFDEEFALQTRATDGAADVIFAANTLCHIPYIDSVLRGVTALLAPGGSFVFEDPYFGDVLANAAFDQIYDEHFYFFTAGSVRAMASRHGLELVDVERLPVHGGEVRYTLRRHGSGTATQAVADLLAQESAAGITDPRTLRGFVTRVERNRTDLVTLLTELRAQGRHVVGYGATAKSATVTNYCGIGPDLVPYICDTTPAKQGRLTPGAHIPVRPHTSFREPYPDYALLFAWNHAAEIMAHEREFSSRGGRWILYVPDVRVV